MNKYFWLFSIGAIYTTIAFAVFSWRHPQWNDMQGFKHLPEVLTFRKVVDYGQR